MPVEMKTAIYPLSADPIHNGHVWNIQEARKLFDKVYVAIGNNPVKKCLFTPEERKALAMKAISILGLDNIEVDYFSGLLAHYASEKGASAIVRGARNSQDFEYEQQLAEFNSRYGLATIILPSPQELRTISSSSIKAVASEGGFVHQQTHPAVKQALEEKLNNTYILGVTGNSGSGKSYFCEEFAKRANAQGIKATHLDMDALIKSLYKPDSPHYEQVKEGLKKLGIEDTLNLKALGKSILGDKQKREALAEILRVPATIELEKFIKSNPGIILFDCAYLVEQNMLPLVNYNIIHVTCDEEKRKQRIIERDNLSKEGLEARLKAQISPEEIKSKILAAQKYYKHGLYIEVDSENIDYNSIIYTLRIRQTLKEALGCRYSESDKYHSLTEVHTWFENIG
jgi:pantetheine-phosphate adenylyltransferase